MAIPYQTAKFKSTNILAITILGSTAKFNSYQYFWLYGIHVCTFPVSKAFEDVRSILSASGSEIRHEYNIGPTFQGFSATMSER